MKLRTTAALFSLAVIGCNVTDEAVVGDATPQGAAEPAAAEPAAAARPTGPMERVRAAIVGLPEENGWPDLFEFEALVDAGIKPYRLTQCEQGTLQADGKLHTTGPLLLGEVDGQWAMLAHADQSNYQWSLNQAWESPRFNPESPTFEAGEAKLECHAPTVQTVTPTPSPFGTFVYASVLTTPAEPTFVEPKIAEGNDKRLEPLRGIKEWNEAQIQELLELGPPAGDPAWIRALRWAKGHDRLDLAYEIHRRYRPMGRCSRDTLPQRTKQTFASVCDDLSRPRCHLALSVELLGYRHSRVFDMWIGGKPVSYTSPLSTLPDALDKELFLLGLLVDYPGTPHNEASGISPRFFALALDGSADAARLDATLAKWLQNPVTDVWNRHRFAVALYFLRVFSDGSTDQREHAKSVAALDGVPAVTVAQLTNVVNHKDE